MYENVSAFRDRLVLDLSYGTGILSVFVGEKPEPTICTLF